MSEYDRLYELIDRLCKLGNGDTDGNSEGNRIAQEARAVLARAPRADGWEECAIEASALLQCNLSIIKDCSEEWEIDRQAWIDKWAPALLGGPLPEPPKEEP